MVDDWIRNMNINWKDIKHFSENEFSHPDEMSYSLLYKLSLVTADSGVSIFITSSFRPGDDGAHGEGKAIDISDNLEGNPISSRWRFKVLRSMFRHDFSRIGIYDRQLHGDISESRDQEVCWHGLSS